MNIEFSAEDEAFRQEVQSFLQAKLTPQLRHAAEKTTTVFADKDVAMAWQEILVEKGWAVPAWPVEHGGTDWTPTQKYIWGQECAKAHAPGLIPLGLRMLAPVIFKYGTDEQKADILPKMLSGEQYWCQGYSEPGSGSDLSSLKTSARKDGDDYIVNGTKIWTTHAQFAGKIRVCAQQPDLKFRTCLLDYCDQGPVQTFRRIFGTRETLIPGLLNNPRRFLIDMTEHCNEILATHFTGLTVILQPIILHC